MVYLQVYAYDWIHFSVIFFLIENEILFFSLIIY